MANDTPANNDKLILLDADFLKDHNIIWRPLYGQETWAGAGLYKEDVGLYVHKDIVTPIETMAHVITNCSDGRQLCIVAAYRPPSLQAQLCYLQDPDKKPVESTHATGTTIAGCVARNGEPSVPIVAMINAHFNGEGMPELSEQETADWALYANAAKAAGFIFPGEKPWHIELPTTPGYQQITGHEEMLLNQPAGR